MLYPLLFPVSHSLTLYQGTQGLLVTDRTSPWGASLVHSPQGRCSCPRVGSNPVSANTGPAGDKQAPPSGLSVAYSPWCCCSCAMSARGVHQWQQQKQRSLRASGQAQRLQTCTQCCIKPMDGRTSWLEPDQNSTSTKLGGSKAEQGHAWQILQAQLGPAMATCIRNILGQTSKCMQRLTGQLFDIRVQGSGGGRDTPCGTSSCVCCKAAEHSVRTILTAEGPGTG